MKKHLMNTRKAAYSCEPAIVTAMCDGIDNLNKNRKFADYNSEYSCPF